MTWYATIEKSGVFFFFFFFFFFLKPMNHDARFQLDKATSGNVTRNASGDI